MYQIAASSVPHKHSHTRTHTHHATLLPTLNNTLPWRDGAAAVATRERCRRAETVRRSRGGGGGLQGDWLGTDFCADVIPPLSPAHPFIPSHPAPACCHPPTPCRREGGREGGYFCARSLHRPVLLNTSGASLSSVTFTFLLRLSPSASSLYIMLPFPVSHLQAHSHVVWWLAALPHRRSWVQRHPRAFLRAVCMFST